mmetsp:Transcript_13517/g.40874  ORF Transcript_13517/g.40874 Transcript_13517/m.40874 type:complete len:129 (-) Transcript_13517:536-922(-)
MGCFSSKQARRGHKGQDDRGLLTPPKWKSTEPLTRLQLDRMREEFWETSPHYGGDRVIWDALKGAAEADPETRRLIVESAGIVVGPPDLTVCYDERGAKYELPPMVWSDPTNGLVPDPSSAQGGTLQQ